MMACFLEYLPVVLAAPGDVDCEPWVYDPCEV